MSITDRHYLSATSDLIQDSETSTNGISYHRNLGSLCNSLEADLIAAGIVKPDLPRTINEEHESPSLFSFDRKHESPLKDKKRDSPKLSFSDPDEIERLNNEEEERRLKEEETLKEEAKREEEARLERQRVIDNILSKTKVNNQIS